MRLINAEHLKKRATDLDDDCWDYYGQSTADFLEYIDNEPTVDAIEVVRCKDCKHRHDGGYVCPMVPEWGYEPNVDDDFCSFGERRDEDETN